MNLDTLAHLLTIITLTCGFSLGRDTIEWQPNRAEIVELVALEDGTALVTQHGDAGSFISRIRADGTRMWIRPVPGDVVADSIGANDRGVAVLYNDDRELGIATYAPDGARHWTHVLSRDHDGIPGRARPAFAGSVVIASWLTNELHLTGLAADSGAVLWDRTSGIDGVATVGEDSQAILRNGRGEFAIDRSTGQLAPHGACASSPDGMHVVACGWYRSRRALLLANADDATLVLLDGEGHASAEQVLPHVRAPDSEVMGGIPPARIAFSGELPRYVPLVVTVGEQWQPILVDMENLSVVGRGAPADEIEVLRDGDIACVLSNRSSLSVFLPGTHELVPVARIARSLDVTQIGGGLVWTFTRGTLAAPGVTATPALPRRV